ncbi:Piso0_002807 [Millerozyma farinosa CBS 7064]|uniref:Piso0_002807 protein n=1 Tax=Pichia sorbitophila (strain ATCC MYA-4447 / BCRC 22081 / CBS 7064 / NBRC 10061 / NRRL Y-12695) TaxID=559304 RepID=G8YDK2_PICSO|nr:Piso0_002807 [Millerozyma farinosa CBS 7064]
MMILAVLSVLGIITGFIFLVLAIASGLYYISEIVEEHSEPTKRLLTKLIYGIIGTLILLWLFDGFPFTLIVFSVFSYYVYLQNLHKFPYVQLSSTSFLASCVLVIANHFLWFNHFHNPYIPPLSERLKPDYKPPHIPSFVEICSFFGLCVWLVPFALFVSLSAHDNLLPHHLDNQQSSDKKSRTALAKITVTYLREFVYSTSRKLGYELDPNHGQLV